MNDAQIDDPQESDQPSQTVAAQSEGPMPTATLTLKRGGIETDIVFTIGSPATVGRFDPAIGPIDVDLGSLDEGQYVSRKHAQFEFDGSNWTVSDLGSSNGTFVMRPSGAEKVEHAEIANGDEIAFGNARVVFHHDPNATAQPPLVAEGSDAPNPDEAGADSA